MQTAVVSKGLLRESLLQPELTDSTTQRALKVRHLQQSGKRRTIGLEPTCGQPSNGLYFSSVEDLLSRIDDTKRCPACKNDEHYCATYVGPGYADAKVKILFIGLDAGADTRFHIPLLLALTTGMRRGEFLGLRWADIDLPLGTVTVRRSVEQTHEGIGFKSPKGKRGRLISLPALTVDALKEHRQHQNAQRKALGKSYREDDLVCTLEDGSLWAPDAFTSQFARLARRIGLKGIRLHDMRHSHATHLLQQGVHPKIVSERLGHSTVAITLDTYSHVLPGMQEDAAVKVDSTLREAIRQERQKRPT